MKRTGTAKCIRTAAAVFCVVVLLLSLCGCSKDNSGVSFGEYLFGLKEPQYSEIRISLPIHAGYSALEGKDSYSALASEEQRLAYTEIEKSLFLISPEEEDGRFAMAAARIPKLSSGEIFMVKEAVLADHPEAFWITGDYMLGSTLADGMYLQLYSDYSYEVILSMTKALEKSVSSALKQIPSNISEYERELLIHDIIVDSCRYDSDSVETAKSYTGPAASYGALVNRTALCSGYAKAAKLLLNRVGIASRTVKGVAGGVGHMWNLVKIDGKWYHLDLTWDDAQSFSDESSYDYFNLTDGLISTDHLISPGYKVLSEELAEKGEGNSLNFYNFDMPECTALEANFYTKNAVLIDDLGQRGEAVLERLLIDRTEKGETGLYVSFPDYMEQDIISSWLISSLKQTAENVNALERGKRIAAYTFTDRQKDPNTPWPHVYCITIIFG